MVSAVISPLKEYKMKTDEKLAFNISILRTYVYIIKYFFYLERLAQILHRKALANFSKSVMRSTCVKLSRRYSFMLSRPSLGGSDAGLYKAVYDFLPTKRTYTFNIFKTVYGRGIYNY